MSEPYIPQPGRRVSICEMQQIHSTGKDGGEQTAPTYAILPNGEKAYRFFWIGVLTDTKKDEKGGITGSLSDPTGLLRMKVHPLYQTKAYAALSSIGAPCFIAVSGKVNIFVPPDAKDGDRFISLKPDDLAEATRIDRLLWTRETLQATDNRYPEVPEWWNAERQRLVTLIDEESQKAAVPA